MNKIVYFFVAVFICGSIPLMAQNDVIISGGNLISSTLCVPIGSVYTWGKGIGASPTKVNFPVSPLTGFPVTIQQVYTGGTHFIALDCDGHVWTWGGNSNGQVGCTNIGGTFATPTMVPTGLQKDVSGYLSRVTSVSAGVNTSFAILETGEVVGWGANTEGQLGDGTLLDRCSPVFVLQNGSPTHLSPVIQVVAGNVTTYALIGDNIESGTVFSWGSTGAAYSGNVLTVVASGLLGRKLSGGYAAPNAPLELGKDPYAKPVYLSTIGVLTNISNIGAGYVFGMALDLDGHIWSWGHDAWAGATGTNDHCANADFAYPKRVKAGSALGTPADDGAGYLLASAIAAGQGFAMAVTIDNKPMAWGNNACGNSASGGGCLGNPATTACNPVYIFPCGSTVPHSDVTKIFKGDTWGYYTRRDGSIYAWGTNDVGQLGIGTVNSAGQTCATKLNLPCALPDPVPSAYFNMKDTAVCPNSPISIPLNTGFQVSPIFAPNYKVTWYQNGTVIPGSTGFTYTATNTGLYKATIQYIGPNSPCQGYPIASDSVLIRGLSSQFQSCVITSQEENFLSSNLPHVSPNPFKEQITIKAPSLSLVIVYSSTGMVREEISINESGKVLVGQEWTKGMYIIQVSGASGIQSYKVIKE